ncbi:hypothetical protein TIFTF001_014228 [Ficus carica]|uniref:NTF2-like domain-containing protein n=1 Tax=Ficus carica TaxID=3494 RepID=A0AA88AFN1_FICCA|nr:hypothetical protein TIFTF001_014228 [Ficus carica]
MATMVSLSSSNLLNLNSRTLHSYISLPNPCKKLYRIRCAGENPPASNSTTEPESVPENALLKVAWNASELLGIATSFFRSTKDVKSAEQEARRLAADGSGSVDRTVIVQAIKEDFDRSYFVTGNLTLDAYEEDCEFADPASSFKGLRRFKRNCTNFGSLLEKSDMKLMKWEDFEDKGIGHWRFSCILAFPWRPILSASGYTEYFFDAQSGKVCRHVEHWNVPKMALLKQILRPSRKFWSKTTG